MQWQALSVDYTVQREIKLCFALQLPYMKYSDPGLALTNGSINHLTLASQLPCELCPDFCPYCAHEWVITEDHW